jgi:hypothetical protein
LIITKAHVGALTLVMHKRRRATLWSAAILAAATVGCGYTTRGLYPDDIQTVHVPIFQSHGLRRDVEFQLTEKVIQAIEARTPFKVVSSPHADTELRGTITALNKHPFGEDVFDNPRGGSMILDVQVTWVDKRSGQVLNEGAYRIDRTVPLETMQTFVIESGQSITTATADAIDQVADQIVTLMQTPW